MNNNINSAFVYEGKATLKFVRNNKTYKIINSHNNAKPLFFKYILQSITGNNVSENMPRFLILNNTNGDPILSYRVPLSCYVDDSDSETPIARFTGYIPYGAIKGTGDTNNSKSITISKLCIYNQSSGNDDSTLLATVNIPIDSQNTTVTSGTTIIVEWNVTVMDANKDESEEDSTQSLINDISNIISNRTLLKQVRG